MSDDNGKKDEGTTCQCGAGNCCSGPGIWIWIALIVAVVAILIVKNVGKKDSEPGTSAPNGSAAVAGVAGTQAVPEPVSQKQPLPRLVDLGATKCIPCKMMAPILDDLKRTYAGRLDVQFIDVWENPDAGKKYGISVIPTQIFYDSAGKELFRHEGFLGKEDILAKWKELGVELGESSGVRSQQPE